MGKKPSDVKAILLTHGHSDHYGGIYSIKNVPVYADSNDIKLIEGRRKPSGIFRKMIGRVGKNNVFNFKPLPFTHDTLFFSCDTIVIIPVPGHTMGSVAFLWKNILFAGDAFNQKKNKITTSPSIFSENNKMNIQSLYKLLNYQFDIAVTGHSGKIENADIKLKEYLLDKKQER